jgi:hypothetical protein
LAWTPQQGRSSKTEPNGLSPDRKTLELLNQNATAKLVEIVRRSVGQEAGWEGYDVEEVIAARALLDKDSVTTIR